MSQVTIPPVVQNVVTLGRGARRGSGLAIGGERIVTLARNVRREQVEVVFPARDLAALTGRVLGQRYGVALIEAPGLPDGPALSWGAEPDLGETVLAFGDPGTGLRVTAGTISAPAVRLREAGRDALKLIEHTAPLPHGAGGGPLTAAGGAVLGLNAMRGDPGFLLALPAAAVQQAIAMIKSGQGPRRLGVAVAGAEASRRMREAVGLEPLAGVLVRHVEADGPADRAGVRPGDLLRKLGETELADADSLLGELESGRAGPRRLVAMRATEELDLSVELEDRP